MRDIPSSKRNMPPAVRPGACCFRRLLVGRSFSDDQPASTDWAAASLATGTRNGEQLT